MTPGGRVIWVKHPSKNNENDILHEKLDREGQKMLYINVEIW